MYLNEGLELLVSLSKEKSRLEDLAKREGWEYRTNDPNAKWMPTFNLKENEIEVRRLDKMLRRLKRTISTTNAKTEIPGINDTDYEEWL